MSNRGIEKKADGLGCPIRYDMMTTGVNERIVKEDNRTDKIKRTVEAIGVTKKKTNDANEVCLSCQ
jgi:hypothetical protein